MDKRTKPKTKDCPRSHDRTIEQIQASIDKEVKMTEQLQQSVDQWTGIIENIESGLEVTPHGGSEWKSRYNYQRENNKMLQHQSNTLRSELHMLKKGQVSTSTDKDRRERRLGDYYQHLRKLHDEKQSLSCAYNMYTRRLDDVSREYHRMKEEIYTIVNDICFGQENRIKLQEENDRRLINAPSRVSRKAPTQKKQKPPTVLPAKRVTSSTSSIGAGSYVDLYAKHNKLPIMSEKSNTKNKSKKVNETNDITLNNRTKLPPIQSRKSQKDTMKQKPTESPKDIKLPVIQPRNNKFVEEGWVDRDIADDFDMEVMRYRKALHPLREHQMVSEKLSSNKPDETKNGTKQIADMVKLNEIPKVNGTSTTEIPKAIKEITVGASESSVEPKQKKKKRVTFDDVPSIFYPS